MINPPHVVCGIATHGNRMNGLVAAVASLLPQVDRVYVYLAADASIEDFLRWYKGLPDNDSDRVVYEVEGRHLHPCGDAGKFRGLRPEQHYRDSMGYGPFYYFSADDDLIYADGVVDYMRRRLDEKYNNKAIVGLHGVLMDYNAKVYYRDRKVFHCQKDLAVDTPVNCLGTGVMMMRSDALSFSFRDMKIPNMADIWLALFASQACVPMIALAHKGSWLQDGPVDSRVSIWRQWNASGAARRKHPGNEIVRSRQWPIHCHPNCTQGVNYWNMRMRRVLGRFNPLSS